VPKAVRNATRYDDGSVLLECVRLAWPHIANPYSSPIWRHPAYFTKLLLPKVRDEVAELIFEIERYLSLHVKEMKGGSLLRDGDDELLSPFEEGQGHWIISCRSESRPMAIGRNGDLLSRIQAEEIFYPGVWADVLIQPQLLIHPEFGARMICSFNVVQWAMDDVSFVKSK
jgi:Protein of unknown function (DUF2815)